MYNSSFYLLLKAQNAKNYDKVYSKILHETYHRNFDKAIIAGTHYTEIQLNLLIRLKVLCCWLYCINEKEM